MPVFGLNNGLIPIVAYNYGAGKRSRLVKAIKCSLVYAFALLFVGFIVFQTVPAALLGMFEASEEMLAIGVPALHIIGIHFLAAWFCIIAGSVFQALGNGVYSLVVSVARQLVVLLPVAYILAQLGGLNAVWWSFPIAEMMSLCVSALFMILHLYALSMECAAIMLVIFLVMFLLYFRFSPKDALVVILTPMCFALKIPYVMPLAMGLLGTPASAVSVGCGVVVSFLIGHVTDNATAIMSMDSDDMATRFRFIIDSFLDNKEMLFTIAAFAVTITVVYLIRRMSVDYAWTIAIIAGALTDVVLLLVGDLMFDTNVSFGGIIIGTIIAVLIAKVVEFFSFNLDYSRTEKVQFEDDEYYYYVKAIPKFTVSTPSRTVKRINATRKHSSGSHPKNNN